MSFFKSQINALPILSFILLCQATTLFENTNNNIAQGIDTAYENILMQACDGLIIIIKCMCSPCRRDDIHVCFAYASPQRMPHMYDNKIVSLEYIK